MSPLEPEDDYTLDISEGDPNGIKVKVLNRREFSRDSWGRVALFTLENGNYAVLLQAADTKGCLVAYCDTEEDAVNKLHTGVVLLDGDDGVFEFFAQGKK